MLDPQNYSHKITEWFNTERAHLAVPGRGEPDPYAIWVAEIMLQQTQVATVWPYYKKWMADYPSISHLAAAGQDSVLKSWEGLGYYSRARNLHRGARLVMQAFGGKLPDTLKELLTIPGIGPYTAAAIASIAFNVAAPLIDGNVLRVFSRLTRYSDDITLSKSKTEITNHLDKLIPPEAPGAFNQGLMDLGRVICTPRNPHCGECPLIKVCAAFKIGDMESFPVKPQRKSIPHYQIVVGLIRRNNLVLIQRRPNEGLLGGMWEFPGGKIEPGETGEQALLREIKEETELEISIVDKIGTIKHAYTHFKITLTAWFCEWQAGDAKIHAATENRWVSMSDLKDYAIPKANLKILDILNRR